MLKNQHDLSLSVLVPTRNRPQYLTHCLRTILDQRTPADEVIVCDNSDEGIASTVKGIVSSFGCQALTYVRPSNAPLSMSDNWNYAIEKSTKAFITIVGDDDGLLPDCIDCSKQVLRQSHADVFRWNWAFYYWPSYPYRNSQNLGWFPLTNDRSVLKYWEMDGRTLLKEVIRGRSQYSELPMLYNSFVHRRVLAKICEDRKPLLDAQAPDIYSGIAIACIADCIVTTDHCLGIAGQGGAANGASSEYARGESEVTKDFRQLNSTNGRGQVLGTIDLGVYAAQVTDAYCRFRERHQGLCKGMVQRQDDLADWQSREVASSFPRNQAEDRDAAMELLIEWFAQKGVSSRRIRENFGAYELDRSPLVQPGLDRNRFGFKGELFKVGNVAEVSNLISELLGTPTDISYSAQKEREMLPGRPRLKYVMRQFVPPVLFPLYSFFRSKCGR